MLFIGNAGLLTSVQVRPSISRMIMSFIMRDRSDENGVSDVELSLGPGGSGTFGMGSAIAES